MISRRLSWDFLIPQLVIYSVSCALEYGGVPQFCAARCSCGADRAGGDQGPPKVQFLAVSAPQVYISIEQTGNKLCGRQTEVVRAARAAEGLLHAG
jgi:hypothetical protein